MSGYTVTARVGNVTTGQTDWLFAPHKPRAGGIGVVLLHGAGAPNMFLSPYYPNTSRMAAALASAGIPCIAGAMGLDAFAIDAVAGAATTSYINQAIAFMAAQTGCRADKAHVIGGSMGAGTGLRWAALNPAKAASVTGIIPMVSILHLHQDNPGLNVAGSFTAGIATAWGTAYRAVADAVFNSTTTVTSATAAFAAGDVGAAVIGNAGAGVQPGTTIAARVSATQITLNKPTTSSGAGKALGIAAQLPTAGTAGANLVGVHAPVLAANAIPSRWFYSTVDPYIYPADVQAAATAAAGTAIAIDAVNGHSDATIGAVRTYSGAEFSELIAWLTARGA